MKQKQHSCSCRIAELSGEFLHAYIEISKLAACILKQMCKIFYISCKKYIYIWWWLIRTKYKATMLMNGIAFVITKMLPEMNYTCSRSSQMNKTVRMLSCKVLWCSISDAWAAVFFYEIRRSELDPFFCSMNNDEQVQLLIANWTEASGNTILRRTDFIIIGKLLLFVFHRQW